MEGNNNECQKQQINIKNMQQFGQLKNEEAILLVVNPS